TEIEPIAIIRQMAERFRDEQIAATLNRLGLGSVRKLVEQVEAVLFYTGAGATERYPAPVPFLIALPGRADAALGRGRRERRHWLRRSFHGGARHGCVAPRHHGGNQGTEAAEESEPSSAHPVSDQTEGCRT